jgi:pimeloyl-ACP methyl ester carboxylesterase
MGTVRSKDGTTIAFDAWGDGQPLIMIDGATSYRGVNPTNAEVGQLLADEFRVYAYDRRGRGESTDTAPYAVEREIEDLAALIADAGAPAVVFGWSSGAVLALDAAAAGLPITRLALFEPPFVVDNSRPPRPADYVQRLDDCVAHGRRGEAVELFLTAVVGMPATTVGGVRQSPFWPALEAVAHTIAYDGQIMGTTMLGAPPAPRSLGRGHRPHPGHARHRHRAVADHRGKGAGRAPADRVRAGRARPAAQRHSRRTRPRAAAVHPRPVATPARGVRHVQIRQPPNRRVNPRGHDAHPVPITEGFINAQGDRVAVQHGRRRGRGTK